MRVAVMQPYFFPYLGYYQLMNVVDVFVVYDDVKYTKRGWINRNRIQRNGSVYPVSLPLVKGTDHQLIRERQLADGSYEKLRRQISGAYQDASYKADLKVVLDRCFNCISTNLFEALVHQLTTVNELLHLQTKFLVSSAVAQRGELGGKNRLLDLLKHLDATEYFNLPGGRALYDADEFRRHGIELLFLESNLPQYNQGWNGFLPSLSLLDQIAWSGLDHIASRSLSEFNVGR